MSFIKRCMLDIETLDTAPTAKILSLGAVEVEGSETFYIEFNQNSQYIRTESQATKDWWVAQSVPMPSGDMYLEDGLAEFSKWYTACNFDEVWCKGTDFDLAILSNAYKECKLERPWKYHQVRDYRTLAKCFPSINPPLTYNNHNALVDAICQAAHLKNILLVQNVYQSQP